MRRYVRRRNLLRRGWGFVEISLREIRIIQNTCTFNRHTTKIYIHNIQPTKREISKNGLFLLEKQRKHRYIKNVTLTKKVH